MQTTSSLQYNSPPLILFFLSVGTYYTIQAFVSEEIKAYARQVVRKAIPFWKTSMRIPEGDLTRGDGLQSIFKNTDAPFSLDDCKNKAINNIPSEWDIAHEDSDMTDVQQIAFDSLLSCGVIDSSIGLGVLKTTLRKAKLLHKLPGDHIFKYDDEHRNDIFILKSGACEVLYHDHNDASSSSVVLRITERRLLASVVDVVSWIIGHSTFQSHITVRCTEECEVISIPSPRCVSLGELQSPMYICSYASLVRSLLIRFSRTTVTSSLFYLGLAEHMLPKAPPMIISPELKSICKSIKRFETNDSTPVKLIKDILAKLIGVSPDEIHLPLAAAQPLTATLAPLEFKRYRNGSVGNNLTGMVSLPPPPPRELKRTKSLGVHQVYDDSSTHLHDSISSDNGDQGYRDSLQFLCPSDEHHEVKTGVMMLAAGQSILDVDALPGCYVVISGRVGVQFEGLPAKYTERKASAAGSLPYIGRNRLSHDMTFGEGEVLGQISLLLGNSSEWYGRCDNNLACPAVLVMKALEDTYLLKVPMVSYEQVVAHTPGVIFTLAHLFVAELPPIIRLFDFCTKWIRLSGGEDIVKQGQKATGKLHIVLFGRVRMLVQEAKKGSGKSRHSSLGSDERQHYVMGRGALIGDSQLLTGGNYQHTVRAIRQTMVSEISEYFLHFLADAYPSILTHIARNVSDRHELSQVGSPPSKSFLVLPISASAPVNSFTSTLKRCFSHCANKVNLVTSNDVRVVFDTILDGLSDHEYILTVGNWLHQIEMDSDIVIYQADNQFSMWNELCLIRTDEILLLANAADRDEGVQMKRMERAIISDAKNIPKTLVLIYVNPPSGLKPRGTREWIEAREGINRHVHVKLHINTNFEYDTMHYSSDCNRLARILTNNAVGLVLGGGGARGISHVGVLQALEESGIPVDMIGGTSIGAFVSACYARENAFMPIFPIIKAWALISSSYWFYLLDLTFPYTSYFNGKSFTKSIEDIFKDDKIEDFWLSCYFISTDLTSHGERVHMNGTAYRYIRASMSLTNYLPPLCDKHPQTGANHYLVDGGYVNCVPISVMRQEFGAKTIIAVDVSGNWNLTATYDYGNQLNGLSVLQSKLNPFAKDLNVPSMADIADQLAFVSAVQQVEKVKDLADVCICPPVQQYSVLEFDAFDALKRIGLESARKEIEKWLTFLDTEVGASSRQDGKYSWVNNAKTKLSFGHPSTSDLTINMPPMHVKYAVE